MHKAVRHLAAATGVLVAAGVLPIVVTAPAEASPKDCASFLAGAGYKVGPKVRAACSATMGLGTPDIATCLARLGSLGVRVDLAQEACFRA